MTTVRHILKCIAMIRTTFRRLWDLLFRKWRDDDYPDIPMYYDEEQNLED